MRENLHKCCARRERKTREKSAMYINVSFDFAIIDENFRDTKLFYFIFSPPIKIE